MSNKVLFQTLILAICGLLPLNAEESSIDKQIETVKTEIELHRRQAMKAEIESQSMMLDDWSDYAQKIEITEKNEQEIQKLEKQLKMLLQQKKDSSSVNNK